MRTNAITTCFVLFFTFLSSAQINNEDVLFTVGETPVYASEFLRVYNKNLDLVKDESQKNIDEYLKLFVNYKLKLAEAKALDFHKKPSYQRELNGYKKQLAKNYLTDHEVTDALVKEAYDRVSHDVNAKHILLMLDASRKDTLETYNRLLEFRERFLNEDFETLQKELHNGSTVLVEDLGYFSGFKMVYDFENAAFNTKVGDVSMPFRTQFGYHIVKVFNKRKSRGEVTVGHIMVSNKQNDASIKPEVRIQEINKLVKQGEDFEALARQFSDDKSSANKGGKLAPFKSGQLSSVKFEDKAFSMTSIDEISEPFKTDYGWHIVKLYEKKLIGPFEELKYELENKVRRDARSKLINSSLQNRLRKKYGVAENNPAQDYFVSILNTDFYKRAWVVPQILDKEKPFLKIGDKQFTYGDFVIYLRAKQKGVDKEMTFSDIVDGAYQAFINSQILKYHEENLENENVEFAQILAEYREGLLLFDLMEAKIWNAVKNDSVGIQKHYDANKNKYVWQERVDAVVATATKQNDIEKVRSMLNKGVQMEDVKVKLNQGKEQKVIFTSGIMSAEHQALPKGFDFKKGISEVYTHNGTYHVVKVNEVLPEAQKELEDVRGLVISSFQDEVEKNWLEELESKFKVSVNKKVLAKVKSEIYN